MTSSDDIIISLLHVTNLLHITYYITCMAIPAMKLISPAYYLTDHNFLYIVHIHSVEVGRRYRKMPHQVQ